MLRFKPISDSKGNLFKNSFASSSVIALILSSLINPLIMIFFSLKRQKLFLKINHLYYKCFLRLIKYCDINLVYQLMIK